MVPRIESAASGADSYVGLNSKYAPLDNLSGIPEREIGVVEAGYLVVDLPALLIKVPCFF